MQTGDYIAQSRAIQTDYTADDELNLPRPEPKTECMRSTIEFRWMKLDKYSCCHQTHAENHPVECWVQRGFRNEISCKALRSRDWTGQSSLRLPEKIIWQRKELSWAFVLWNGSFQLKKNCIPAYLMKVCSKLTPAGHGLSETAIGCRQSRMHPQMFPPFRVQWYS